MYRSPVYIWKMTFAKFQIFLVKIQSFFGKFQVLFAKIPFSSANFYMYVEKFKFLSQKFIFKKVSSFFFGHFYFCYNIFYVKKYIELSKYITRVSS